MRKDQMQGMKTSCERGHKANSFSSYNSHGIFGCGCR